MAATCGDFLGFLARHLGEEPDEAALAALRPADLRSFLAARAGDGAGNATRARQLAAVRGFLRHLAKASGRAGADGRWPISAGRAPSRRCRAP